MRLGVDQVSPVVIDTIGSCVVPRRQHRKIAHARVHLLYLPDRHRGRRGPRDRRTDSLENQEAADGDDHNERGHSRHLEEMAQVHSHLASICRSIIGAASCLPRTTRTVPSAGPMVSVDVWLMKFWFPPRRPLVYPGST